MDIDTEKAIGAIEKERQEARNQKARVKMVRDFTGAAAEKLSNGPPISGTAVQYLCLAIEAMLQEVDGE